MRVLNLGCGFLKEDFPEREQATEVVGVDHNPDSHADIVHDLDSFPYPLETDSFDLVIMQDVIEHLENVPATLAEIHRIARNGALVRIRTPHYASWYAYGDPTHKRFFGSHSLDGFDVRNPNLHYAKVRFHFRRRIIEFPKIWRVTGIAALINRNPHRWEQLLAYIIRPENMIFELEVVKD
jgi:SAM-dependent methyltransferase